METMIRKAINMACLAHAGQVDKGGSPYAFHVIRVSGLAHKVARAMGIDMVEWASVVGALHDVVEDTSITLDDLRKDFPEVIVDAVDYVTKRKGETYFDFVKRSIQGGPLAQAVKFADVLDNTSPTRAGNIPSGMHEKYEKTLAMLEAATGLKAEDLR